uniref:Uncharacterized protein n=1 Tax=Octopus bimaculoides TaxID=37653 RepID=A0A0L8HQG8_OCTBM
MFTTKCNQSIQLVYLFEDTSAATMISLVLIVTKVNCYQPKVLEIEKTCFTRGSLFKLGFEILPQQNLLIYPGYFVRIYYLK